MRPLPRRLARPPHSDWLEGGPNPLPRDALGLALTPGKAGAEAVKKIKNREKIIE
jgi:hypothetical protein